MKKQKSSGLLSKETAKAIANAHEDLERADRCTSMLTKYSDVAILITVRNGNEKGDVYLTIRNDEASNFIDNYIDRKKEYIKALSIQARLELTAPAK